MWAKWAAAAAWESAKLAHEYNRYTESTIASSFKLFFTLSLTELNTVGRFKHLTEIFINKQFYNKF